MKQFGIRIQEADSTARSDPAEAGQVLDLRRVVAILRRQLKPILVAAGVALACGLAYILTTPPQYYASAKVLVDDRLSKFTEEVAAATATVRDDTAILNQIQVLQSQSLALTVIGQLGLDQNPSFTDPPESGFDVLIDTVKAPLRWLKATLAGGPAAPAGPALSPDEQEALRQRELALGLAGDIRVSQVGRSYVIEVGYVSHDRALVANVVNTYAEVYLADQLDANFNATRRTTEWLQSRLDELQQNAQDAARAVEEYKAANGLTAIQGELITEQKLSELNTELAEAVAEVARVEALVLQHERVLAAGPAAALASLNPESGGQGADAERMALLQERYAALTERLADVEQNFGIDHPQAQEVRLELAEAARQIMREVRRRGEAARAEAEVARARADGLRAQVEEATGQNAEATRAQVELRELEQRAATLRALFQDFSSRREAIVLQENFPVSNVRILTSAEVPRDPALPRTVPTLAAALLLGLMAGLGIGLVREYRERFFRTGDDVIDVTGLPFLGYLPAFVIPSEAERPGAAPRRLLDRFRRSSAEPAEAEWTPVLDAPHFFAVLTQPHGVYCETLRNIRLAADLSMGPSDTKVVGIVSALPGEGKTTVAANFANLLARSGKRTILVDADLRHPGLSDTLGLTGPGLVQVLIGEADLARSVRHVRETGLDVLPCVQMPDFAFGSDLLQMPSMKALLAEARRNYDYVVIDLPPFGPVIDAKVMLPSLDRVVLVAEWGRTPRDLLRQQLRREPALAAQILGVVLNKVDVAALSKYVSHDGAEAYLGGYGGYTASA